MLGAKLNGNVGNEVLPLKKPYYAKNTELEMTQEIAKKYQAWDVAAILKRATEMIPLIIEVWNFDNPSRNKIHSVKTSLESSCLSHPWLIAFSLSQKQSVFGGAFVQLVRQNGHIYGAAFLLSPRCDRQLEISSHSA